MRSFWALLGREISISMSRGTSLGIGAAFFLSLVILFPFGIGPDRQTLQIVGPAILWTGPLLAILLGIEKLFQPDIEDGTMDLYRLSRMPTYAMVLAKSLSTWLTTALPLILLSPLFGMMLTMDGASIMGCVIALLIGSPSLVFFAVFCGALTAQIPRAGMLTTIIAIPFLIPSLIFGVSASVAFASETATISAPLSVLLALSLLSSVLCTWGGSVILRAIR